MTTPTSVRAFIEQNPNPTRREDAETLLEMMGRISGEPAYLWGSSIIGFGAYHYRYASGREGDAPASAFSPRKPATTIYLPEGVGAHSEALRRLGPHTTGVGCLYIKRLSDIDLLVLEAIITESYRTVTAATFPHRASESASHHTRNTDEAR